jgi:hypothetical protein
MNKYIHFVLFFFLVFQLQHVMLKITFCQKTGAQTTVNGYYQTINLDE